MDLLPANLASSGMGHPCVFPQPLGCGSSSQKVWDCSNNLALGNQNMHGWADHSESTKHTDNYYSL